jgi:hypothetical protein
MGVEVKHPSYYVHTFGRVNSLKKLHDIDVVEQGKQT